MTLALVVAACGAVSLEAQGPSDGREGPFWSLKGLRNRQCVRFLVDPRFAAKESHTGYRPIRADQDQSLHPALRTVIAGQPEFASWTSSALCFYYVDTVGVGGRVTAEKNARKPQMLGVWTLATAEQGSGARRDLVLELSSSSARVVRAAEAAKLRLREAGSAVSNLQGSSEEQHRVTLGKTRLTWTGRAVGDSSAVEQPIEESWLFKGASGVVWGVRATIRPTWSRGLVGLLQVEGKDDLAKALKASPIRFVGPRYLGGSGELRFSR